MHAPSGGGCPQHGRARPLPPDERRAALVAATLPLVAQYGRKVTTRQIADAAGVAEGTIFRVFPSKDELVGAAIEAALDPEPVLAELSTVDMGAALDDRLLETVVIVQRRLTSVFNLLITLGFKGPPDQDEASHARKRHNANRIDAAVGRVLAPDADRFRCSIPEVVRLLRLLTFAGTHPMITDGELLRADQIVSVLLDGVRHPTTEAHGGHQC